MAAFYQALILGHLKQYDAALPILHGLLTTVTDAAETARILAEIDALYRFRVGIRRRRTLKGGEWSLRDCLMKPTEP